MLGKNPRLTALQARKQLLIAESELNRAQLAGDLAEIKKNASALAENAKSFTVVGSAVGAVIAGVRAFARHKAAGATNEPKAKPSAFRTILRGASLVSSIWMASRARARGGDGPQP